MTLSIPRILFILIFVWIFLSALWLRDVARQAPPVTTTPTPTPTPPPHAAATFKPIIPLQLARTRADVENFIQRYTREADGMKKLHEGLNSGGAHRHQAKT